MAKPLELGNDEILWFGFDWTQRLEQDDTGTPTDSIATSTWVVPAGLTEVLSQTDGIVTTIKLDGTGGTVGTVYEVTNVATTTVTGETMERTLKIKVVEAKYK